MESSLVSTEKEAEARATEEELKLLRFNHHKTAFDVDIGALDSHPWRHQHVNVLDYFNYGFTEATWLVRQIFLCLNSH